MDLRAARAPARECPCPSFPQESWPRLSNSLVFLHCRHRDSKEKHEPVSDIDTVVVDSLKALASAIAIFNSFSWCPPWLMTVLSWRRDYRQPIRCYMEERTVDMGHERSSQERISKLASRLFVSGLAPVIIRRPAQRPPSRRRSPHGDARWTSAKRQGGPDPPETKVGVFFSIERP